MESLHHGLRPKAKKLGVAGQKCVLGGRGVVSNGAWTLIESGFGKVGKGPIPRPDEISENRQATKQNLSQGQGAI